MALGVSAITPASLGREHDLQVRIAYDGLKLTVRRMERT
jgi:hypothetical protein